MNLSDEVAAVDDTVAAEAMHLVVTAADDLVVVDVLNLLVGEDSVHGSHVSLRVFDFEQGLLQILICVYISIFYLTAMVYFEIHKKTFYEFLCFMVFHFVVFICFLRRVAGGMWGICCVVQSWRRML